MNKHILKSLLGAASLITEIQQQIKTIKYFKAQNTVSMGNYLLLYI